MLEWINEICGFYQWPIDIMIFCHDLWTNFAIFFTNAKSDFLPWVIAKLIIFVNNQLTNFTIFCWKWQAKFAILTNSWLTKFVIFFSTTDWRNPQFFATSNWENSFFFKNQRMSDNIYKFSEWLRVVKFTIFWHPSLKSTIWNLWPS